MQKEIIASIPFYYDILAGACEMSHEADTKYEQIINLCQHVILMYNGKAAKISASLK